MLIVTICVDAPVGQAIGVKEAIAQDLEKYGDVRVVSVEERKPVQIDMLCSMSERAKMADLLRLEEYQDIGTINHLRELAQSEKDGRQPATTRGKTCDANTAEAEYLLGVLWNGLHNNDGMDSKVADRVAEIAHEGDKVQPATTPKNDPLTMEELRVMDGEPVWVVFTPDIDGERLAIWALVSVDKENDEIFLLNSIGGSSAYEEVWADIEAIYRRKPEGHGHGL